MAAVLLLGFLPTAAHAAEEGKVTATFNPNGGKVLPTTMDLSVGVPAAKFPKPTRDRHTFLGWFTAKSGGEKLTAAPEKNFTAFAHWRKATKLTVKFDTNGGGKAPADKKVGYG